MTGPYTLTVSPMCADASVHSMAPSGIEAVTLAALLLAEALAALLAEALAVPLPDALAEALAVLLTEALAVLLDALDWLACPQPVSDAVITAVRAIAAATPRKPRLLLASSPGRLKPFSIMFTSQFSSPKMVVLSKCQLRCVPDGIVRSIGSGSGSAKRKENGHDGA